MSPLIADRQNPECVLLIQGNCWLQYHIMINNLTMIPFLPIVIPQMAASKSEMPVTARRLH